MTISRLLALFCAFVLGLGPPAEARAQLPITQMSPTAVSALALPYSAIDGIIRPQTLGSIKFANDAVIQSGSSLGWAFSAGGAVAGGAVGFSVAAPDCLNGSQGCGARPLIYSAAGALAGAVLGWSLTRLFR